MLTIGSLFSGIGGLELGLERAGLGPVLWQAERNTYCLRVLERHWPNAHRFSDVREVTSGNAAHVDLVCGGFPCQPVSYAGKRRAQRDERWLWPELARIVRELEPAIVVAENVPGLRTAGLRDVLADLAALRFDAWWLHLSAAELGAPHLRRRIFIVAAHPDRIRLREPAQGILPPATVTPNDGATRRASDADGARLEGADGRELRWSLQCAEREGADGAPPDTDGEWQSQPPWQLAQERGWASDSGWRAAPPAVRGVDDGLPDGLDGATDRQRIAALGNAVVPQCAELIGRALIGAIDLGDRSMRASP